MFERLLKIISQKELDKLKNSNILLVGVGGVGGSALETLARMGIEHFTIVDNDIIDISNLNRQIISLHSNIGEKKVIVAKNRVLDINPNIKINIIDNFITKDNIDLLFKEKYDFIIDCCDTVTTKVLLIKLAQENNIKIISCLGTGNRLDPTKLEITDIYKTNYDPLAKILRKLLKDEKIKKQDVVYSREIPNKTNSRTPGSSAIVPNSAGIYAAYYVINKLLKEVK